MSVFKDYRVTSEYGWRHHPIHKKQMFHAGIDLAKEHKSPIKAFTSGEVMYAGNGVSGTGVGGFGNVVAIKDKDGRCHVYAHLDSVSVQKGQRVSKGDVIGYQGATGQVTGSHLHYEIRKTSHPYLGWTSNQENSTFEPTKYLEDFYAAKPKANLKVDGYWGPKTTSALQKYLGTVVDGVISGQYRNEITEAIPSVEFGPEYTGSLVIKALQKLIGAKVDGYIGPKTVTKLQQYLKTIVDSKISEPSLMVKELQRRLNKGNL